MTQKVPFRFPDHAEFVVTNPDICVVVLKKKGDIRRKNWQVAVPQSARSMC